VVVNSADRDVNVGMLSVVMDGGDPFELCAQVAPHPSHQLASVLLKVQMVSELRRHDDFEEALVSSTLPIVESSGDA
jgi:PleD family two-component response regulator